MELHEITQALHRVEKRSFPLHEVKVTVKKITYKTVYYDLFVSNEDSKQYYIDLAISKHALEGISEVQKCIR